MSRSKKLADRVSPWRSRRGRQRFSIVQHVKTEKKNLHSRGSWLAVAMWAALIMLLTLTPVPSRQNIGPPNLDKAAHLILFMVLSLLIIRALDPISRVHIRRAWGYSFLVVCLYGAFIEIVQSVLPWRGAEWLDFTADIMGGLIAFPAVMLYHNHIHRRPT